MKTKLIKCIQSAASKRDIKIGFKMAKNILKAHEIFTIDGRICQNILYKIKNFEITLFDKDLSNNYSNSEKNAKCQGYFLSQDGKEFFSDVFLSLLLDNVDVSKDKLKNGEVFLFIPEKAHKEIDKIVSSISLDKIRGTYGLYSLDDLIKGGFIVDNRKKEHFSGAGREYDTFSLMPKDLRSITNTPFAYDLKTFSYRTSWSLFENMYPDWKRTKKDNLVDFFNEYFPSYKYWGSIGIDKDTKDGLIAIIQYLDRPEIFRSNLASELKITKREAKDIFNSIIAGSKNTYGNALLKKIQKGTEHIREKIIHYVADFDNKDTDLHRFVESRMKDKKTTKKLSIFYFILEFYERKVIDVIREYLFEKYPNIEINRVHDCIYSNIELQSIDLFLLEGHIREKTGINAILTQE
jgi:hypothetical protein